MADIDRRSVIRPATMDGTIYRDISRAVWRGAALQGQHPQKDMPCSGTRAGKSSVDTMDSADPMPDTAEQQASGAER